MCVKNGCEKCVWKVCVKSVGVSVCVSVCEKCVWKVSVKSACEKCVWKVHVKSAC
jgi:hypothetical protein